MKQLYKSHIKNSLKKLQEVIKKHEILYEYGVDLSSYEIGLSNCIEESIAIVCSSSEEEFEQKFELVQWWLYNAPELKTVHNASSNEVLHDLTNIDYFVDYLLKSIE